MNPFRLVIPPAVRDAMIAHARAELPNECVGFLAGTVVASIGPVTAEAAQQLGISSTIVPDEYTVPGLVRALVEHFRKGQS